VSSLAPADEATLQAREDAATEQAIPPTYTCSARQCAKVTVACDGKEKCIDALCSKQSRVSGYHHMVRSMTDAVQCNLCPVCKGRHSESSASTSTGRPIPPSWVKYTSNFKKWLCDRFALCADVEKRAPTLDARQWFMTPKGAQAKCWDIANNCPKGNLKDCITYCKNKGLRMKDFWNPPPRKIDNVVGVWKAGDTSQEASIDARMPPPPPLLNCNKPQCMKDLDSCAADADGCRQSVCSKTAVSMHSPGEYTMVDVV
jgi:hypothetical protein